MRVFSTIDNDAFTKGVMQPNKRLMPVTFHFKLGQPTDVPEEIAKALFITPRHIGRFYSDEAGFEYTKPKEEDVKNAPIEIHPSDDASLPPITGPEAKDEALIGDDAFYTREDLEEISYAKDGKEQLVNIAKEAGVPGANANWNIETLIVKILGE